jgi:CheY-like chemotaxis protein
MAGKHYSTFVEEAFIKPIRSVLIIDDDYPTLDEMLNNQISINSGVTPLPSKEWYKDPERIKQVIQGFRTPQRPLLVDVHDCANVSSGSEVKLAAHLHQSDLLILDYQLDPGLTGDGSLAIAIIRALAQSNHFNLVVVHTRENLDTVFRDTLISLLSPLKIALSAEDVASAENLLIDAEDSIEGVGLKLNSSIGLDQYLHFRRFPLNYVGIMIRGHQPYSAFHLECDNLHWTVDARKLICRYLLNKVNSAQSPFLVGEKMSEITWDAGAIKYIKTDSMFIAFSEKGSDGDLLSELLAALNSWNPQPSRLFLAKLRAEMDELGVRAEIPALGNQHALAYWYRRLLQSDGSRRRWLIAESVARHSDQLMNGILPGVEDFATRLIKAEVKAGTPNDLTKVHFGVDLENEHAKLKSSREHNALVSSKSPEGWHLTTGHIFVVGSDYWVCVSPACDMVPTQMSNKKIERFGERLPFLAVKLIPIGDGKVPDDIQTNRYLFVTLDGTVRGYSFNALEGEDSAPTWQSLYADKRGVFTANFEFRVFIVEKGTRGLVERRHTARVVSQLRYEYALNLVQRLGGTLTRIGLDFL